MQIKLYGEYIDYHSCEGKVTVSFEAQRQNMIESQVRTNDVSDLNLINAISSINREEFVADSKISFAYAELEVESKSGRKLMKARDFSKLAQFAKIDPQNNVLVIAGSGGYSANVFKAMKTSVTIVDNKKCEFADITSIEDDIIVLKKIANDAYDVIFVDGGVETISPKWFDKLKENGRLALIQYETSVGVAKIFVKANGIVASKNYFEAKPPKLSETLKAHEFSL